MSKGIDELKDWAMHNVRLISILPSNKNLQVGTKLSDVLEPNVDEKYFLSEERTSQFLKEFPKELPDGAVGFNIKQIGNIDQHKRDRNNPNSGRVYDPSGISPTLSTMQGGGLEPKIIQPALTPDRIEKRQNGRRFKEDGEPMFTLTSQDRHGVAILRAKRTKYGKQIRKDYENGKVKESRHNMTELVPRGDDITNTITTVQKDNLLKNGFRIRKLTPLECWRLQGFTDEQFYKSKNDGVSNSQLYKQAGNSVTVNVIDAIARKLI